MSTIKTTGSVYRDFRDSDITFIHLDSAKTTFGLSIKHGTFMLCGAYCHDDDQFSRKIARKLIHSKMSKVEGTHYYATASRDTMKMDSLDRFAIIGELIQHIGYNAPRRAGYLGIPASKLEAIQNALWDELFKL